MERLLQLFSVWEGRNGARPKDANDVACRQVGAPDRLAGARDEQRRADRGGSDDHGALDIATTWTEAAGATPEEFLASGHAGQTASRAARTARPSSSRTPLGALALNAYRESGGTLSADRSRRRCARSSTTTLTTRPKRHEEITATSSPADAASRSNGARRGVGARRASTRSGRASARSSRQQRCRRPTSAPHTITPAAGVGARTRSRRRSSASERRHVSRRTGVHRHVRRGERRGRNDAPARSGRAHGNLAAPCARPRARRRLRTGTDLVPARLEARAARLRAARAALPAHHRRARRGRTATAGDHPRRDAGAGRRLRARRRAGCSSIPVVGSYHTELGPYALHLTHDLLVAQAMDLWVDWFYRQCRSCSRRPRRRRRAARARACERRRLGRGVDSDALHATAATSCCASSCSATARCCCSRSAASRTRSALDVLLEAFRRLARARARRPARRRRRRARARDARGAAPCGVEFLGELRGEELAQVYASADIFCFPTTTDTFGQVILEAAASGLPVVAAAAGGALELVGTARPACSFRPTTLRLFADALVELVGRRAVPPGARPRALAPRTALVGEARTTSSVARTPRSCRRPRWTPPDRCLTSNAYHPPDVPALRPGFGAVPAFYRPALAADWIVHEPPSFHRAASFRARVQRASASSSSGSTGPCTLAGHSMGAALAVTVALEQPERDRAARCSSARRGSR